MGESRLEVFGLRGGRYLAPAFFLFLIISKPGHVAEADIAPNVSPTLQVPMFDAAPDITDLARKSGLSETLKTKGRTIQLHFEPRTAFGDEKNALRRHVQEGVEDVVAEIYDENFRVPIGHMRPDGTIDFKKGLTHVQESTLQEVSDRTIASSKN